ncbi:MAG TPA: PEP/pyruvate-binding domain-containing protein [Stackebrandtia sp.]|uniref:PEP/pyruvate-binding domain-containing protein n=1 Tax=Stackebrandtia sp. TaxID=2023065 RepID=UPI002D32CC1C|nr:PEP/pyruvate-binding domain-containing protein [Stackebrandtia sp.]HZE38225.1 PEP/pyruvate-binding domain-containing protein [Stackebrandtia sp.]
MSSQELCLPLDSAEAVLETVGGKGASLAVMARAGLPVPQGFHLTTAAYRSFVDAGGAAEAIAEIVADVDATDPAALREASARIQPLFTDGELPGDIARAIAAAYAPMDGAAVAVRSSATAEDLPEASFAGQMDSFLNVSGTEAVIEAVRRCWASLWTDRAIEYRARHAIGSADVTLAVVVQRLVAAESSGVMFTANPVTGDAGQTLINATWGLGESLVGGGVTPDSYVVDTDSGAVTRREIGDKAVETVRTATSTVERDVPEERRRRAVLPDAELKTLADIGSRIAGLYGLPMDVEWARDGAGFQIVQARPITTLPATREVWNDSRDGDYLWTSANLGEAIPSVMTPISFEFMKIFMADAMALAALGPHRLSGNIGGRFYMNMSMMDALGSALGISRFMNSALELAFGKRPGNITAPRLPMGRLKLLRLAIPEAKRFTSIVRGYQKGFDERVATFPRRVDDALAAIAAADDPRELARLWTDTVKDLLHDGGRLLAAGSRINGAALVRIRPWLHKRVSESDASALLTGLHSEQNALASLGPLIGLWQLSRGDIDRATFADRWGHRCPDEFEVSVPRPTEDPAWIDRQLEGLRDAVDVGELLERQRLAREGAMRRFDAAHPRQAARLRKRLAAAAGGTRGREAGRSEAVRSFRALRAFVLRAAALTGIGDDVFMLHIPELLDVLGGAAAPAEAIAARRAAYEHYRGLPVYPTFIRGRFDPEAWSRDPHRRTDLFDADAEAAPAAEGVSGGAGSPGVVEGVVRVIDDPADGGRLGVGEVLVTKVTNIGWTPIFPRAAAVVTDIGATLSHAAIVARELGIPAVVGCGNATGRLRDGDRVRVNGDTGVVEVLQHAE